MAVKLLALPAWQVTPCSRPWLPLSVIKQAMSCRTRHLQVFSGVYREAPAVKAAVEIDGWGSLPGDSRLARTAVRVHCPDRRANTSIR